MIDQAVEALKKGGVIIIPTETVYGLAADIRCPEAIQKIYDIKGRDFNKPMSWHVANLEQVIFVNKSKPSSKKFQILTQTFWPGPLTLIVSDGDNGTIGLRCPSHSMFQELSLAFASPMIATSANLSGGLSPIQVSDIPQEIIDQVDCVLDAGPTTEQVDSTVLDLSGDEPKILREGAVSKEQLAIILDQW